MRNWLSPGFLSTCRSGDDEPNGGVANWICCSRHKSSSENFFQERSDDGKGVLELPGTKVG